MNEMNTCSNSGNEFLCFFPQLCTQLNKDAQGCIKVLRKRTDYVLKSTETYTFVFLYKLNSLTLSPFFRTLIIFIRKENHLLYSKQIYSMQYLCIK